MASVIPVNHASFDWQELVTATAGRCPRFDGEVHGVFTDTRPSPDCADPARPLANGVFVALRGERFDGHEFAAAAVQAGARVLVVEREVAAPAGVAVLRVGSTLQALGDLARFHRLRWRGRVAVVAGSVGKTTTRSVLAALFAAGGHAVHAPRGNLNNLIGVPMVLLAADQRHDLAVVELGTSVPGEIERLTHVTQPDGAVLTRIALEHCERLGDLDAIEREEGAVLAGLGRGASAVTNADDERCLRQLASSPASNRRTYGVGPGRSGADPHYRVSQVEAVPAPAGGSGPLATRVRLERPWGAPLRVDSPLLGRAGAYALAAAVASFEALSGRELELGEVEAALRSAQLGEPGRLAPVELRDGSLVIDDTYNSSPASVQSSIALARELADRRGARLVLVLGEMRELGAASESAHRELGQAVVEAGPALVVAFGGHAALLLEPPRQKGLPAYFAADASAAAALLEREREPGDVILVKASRGLRAERIVQRLRGSESNLA